MSQREFDEAGVTVVIGWDAPLATFYLQFWSEALQTVGMDEDERESSQIWMGIEYDEHLEPDVLLALARQHMPTLPEDLDRDLCMDRQAALSPALPDDHHESVQFLGRLLEGAVRSRSKD